MKTTRILPLVVLGMTMLCGSAETLAENGADRFAQEMADVTETLIKTSKRVSLAQRQGYGLCDGYCICGTYMEPRSIAEFKRHFEKGDEIQILATGDSAALDVDVRVIGPDGDEVVRDNRNIIDATVQMIAPETGEYRLCLELSKSRRPTFCILAVMKTGGHQMELDDLSDLLTRYAFCNRFLGSDAAARGRTVRIRQSESEWSLMGAVLSQHGIAKHWATDVQEGPTIISVYADRNATDVDLYINDSKGERIVVNHDPYPFAIVDFHAQKQQEFSYLISMPRVSDRALALMTIFNAD